MEEIGFPLSRSRPRLHLLGLLNIEIGSFWVGAQGDLAWKPKPQSENSGAAEQRMLKQLFTQTRGDFVSGIATAATFVCGQRSQGDCQYTPSRINPLSLAKLSHCLGSKQ